MEYIDILTKKSEDLPVIKDIAKKAGVPAGYVSLGLIGLVAVFMFLGIAADLITDLIGMFYPMYMSFKALESKEDDDDKLWLTYWVVFALYKVADEWAEIFFFWVPMYYPIKLVFLIYLFAPQTKGAIVLYNSFIRPFVIKHQSRIEEGFSTLGEAASIATKMAKEEAIKKGLEYAASSHK